MVTTRSGVNQWDVVYSRDFRGATSQVVGSWTTGGARRRPTASTPSTSSPPYGMHNADPFVSIGGGTCVAAEAGCSGRHRRWRQWLLDTGSVSVSLGGGVCVRTVAGLPRRVSEQLRDTGSVCVRWRQLMVAAVVHHAGGGWRPRVNGGGLFDELVRGAALEPGRSRCQAGPLELPEWMGLQLLAAG